MFIYKSAANTFWKAEKELIAQIVEQATSQQDDELPPFKVYNRQYLDQHEKHVLKL